MLAKPLSPTLSKSHAMDAQLYVTKRNGESQQVAFDKVLARLQKLCRDPALPPLANVDVTRPSQKVIQQLYPGVSTTELDELAAHQCTSMSTIDPAYSELAKRIVISNLHKNTRRADGSEPRFSQVVRTLYGCTDINGKASPLVSDELVALVKKFGDAIDAEVDDTRDYLFDYFGFKTLEKSYLLRMPHNQAHPHHAASMHTQDPTPVVERPQHMWMRVALGLFGEDLLGAFRCYHELSTMCYTHATPTLFNSGTSKPQLASCFLLQMREDSISGIFDTLGQCAMISKHAGGIGLNIHNVRAKHAMIRGTNGSSNGVVPMLRVFNDTARYVDQGGGKRNGSFAIYLEPWHADVMDFLHLKRNHGDELSRARDLFYALWVPDLFMQRVLEDGEWTLFDPNAAPGLDEVHGKAFEALYAKYVVEGRGCKTMQARKLWTVVLESMVETGTPYILFKDACNQKSNQQNLGTIKSSNLCTEIVEYSSKDEAAVCNLASLCLPACLSPLPSWKGREVVLYTKTGCPFCGLALARLKRLGCERVTTHVYDDTTDPQAMDAFKAKFQAVARETDGVVTFPQVVVDGEAIGGFDGLVARTRQVYDFDKLGLLARSLVRNLNQTIDRTFYPIPETRRSNARHRPIGIGIQGLADVFYTLRYSYDSAEAHVLNEKIFATLYYHAMHESMTMAKERETAVEAVRAWFDEKGASDALQRDAWWTASEALSSVDDQTEAFRQLQRAGLYPSPVRTDAVEASLRDATHPFRAPSHPGAYSTFAGSPLSAGKFQFDLWDDRGGDVRYDWDALRADVLRYGCVNSLLLAPMPTASTAQIMGNTECFEIPLSNIYNRRTLAGEFIVVNKYMLTDLMDAGLWCSDMKDEIIYHEGSVQPITRIPASLRHLYKTVWDTSQKVVLDMAADRGRYICQSQSMNLFLAQPTVDQISSMLMYGWKKGLKTGMYYLRTKPASKAQQFTLDPTKFASHNTRLPTQGSESECVGCSA